MKTVEKNNIREYVHEENIVLLQMCFAKMGLRLQTNSSLSFLLNIPNMLCIAFIAAGNIKILIIINFDFL